MTVTEAARIAHKPEEEQREDTAQPNVKATAPNAEAEIVSRKKNSKAFMGAAQKGVAGSYILKRQCGRGREDDSGSGREAEEVVAQRRRASRQAFSGMSLIGPRRGDGSEGELQAPRR